MSFLDFFALVVMAILLAMVIWLVVLLGSMPGAIALKRGHPQADAIKALGWIGIVTMGISWFVAITWAYTVPKGKNPDALALEDRVKALESQLKQIQGEEDQS